MSDTPVTSESSSRPRITHSTRQLIDRMITHYEKAPDLQDEAEISFHQSMEFDDETTEKLQDKGKQSQSQHSSAESVHFNSSNPSPSLISEMLTFNDDLNQPIYCTAGNLMNLIQMMLQNQMAAAEITQHLTTSTQRDIMRDELWEYQKEVKYALDIKSVITFDGSNYEAWCMLSSLVGNIQTTIETLKADNAAAL
ncbi:uncharacterized protein BDCG_16958 [Blastomyces dermatitidis ER-3]|uniref:Uncharacterized protein n=1 Tax=Ajellomyces dermatitidis (strain ER-3 / ATCC MYA-2586) TaxID=559297 RepID=A0ABX2VVK6_AJEDR|nr:uncharacterized protein BDCG_16958 [Blastomyces dermatitidis ER-3]OAT01194.1 hypothetical protein BDCG_16958 [Blastomyces dermatitidis ER-3]